MMKSVRVLTLMKEDTVVSLCVLLLPPHHHRILRLFSPRRPTKTLFKSDYDDDDDDDDDDDEVGALRLKLVGFRCRRFGARVCVCVCVCVCVSNFQENPK